MPKRDAVFLVCNSVDILCKYQISNLQLLNNGFTCATIVFASEAYSSRVSCLGATMEQHVRLSVVPCCLYFFSHFEDIVLFSLGGRKDVAL